MAAKSNYAADEIMKAGTRFVVGSKKATYINGKSKMAVPTLLFSQAKATLDYFEQMQMGETTVFELVPVELNPDGSITRQV